MDKYPTGDLALIIANKATRIVLPLMLDLPIALGIRTDPPV